jgi:LysM repeat protein
VSSTRDRDRERDRERERAAAAERSGGREGPAWERQRRSEAYPQIRTRVGLPAIPRVAVLAAALVIAALALFVIGPDLLGIGGGNETPTTTASPSAAAATASPDPTPIPAPTPQVYVIKEGDTLSGIARQFGLTVDQLLAANADTITNPDRIAVGDEIIIPVPPADDVGGGSAEPSAAP